MSESSGLRWGVEPICHVLEIAPSTYYDATRRPPSARALADAVLMPLLMALWVRNYSVYGRRKLTKAVQKAGHDVGRDQVARLMRQLGIRGASRSKKRFTTKADPAHVRAPDLVNRDFTATAPNEKWVADFTYCSTWSGIVYVAFVVDVFSRRIVGWKAARTMHTSLVLDALNMAAWIRRCVSLDGLICHSDAGSQGGFRGRRNTSRWRWFGMANRHQRQLAIRAMRGQMWSPGRPSTARREDRVRFWEAIARGAVERGCGRRGRACHPRSGTRWFREAGGMPPIALAPLSGRYLSFAEREEIAILHAQHARGARDRPAAAVVRRRRSRGSCAATRRPAATSWRIGRRRRSGTPSGAPADRRSPSSPPTIALREYVQDRLAGTIARPDGELVAGPDGALHRPPPRSPRGPALGEVVEPGADLEPAAGRLPR